MEREAVSQKLISWKKKMGKIAPGSLNGCYKEGQVEFSYRGSYWWLAFVDLSLSVVSYLGCQAHEKGRKNWVDLVFWAFLVFAFLASNLLLSQWKSEWTNEWMNGSFWAGSELGLRLCAQLSLSTEGWIDKHKFLYLTFKALIFNPIPTYPILFPPLYKFRFLAG